jgi:hypothetical protein
VREVPENTPNEFLSNAKSMEELQGTRQTELPCMIERRTGGAREKHSLALE